MNMKAPDAGQNVIANLIPNEDQTFDFANLIGRVRPATNAHIEIIERGLTRAKFVHINVGSCFQPRTERSPFLYDEVVSMIRGAFDRNQQDRLLFSPVMDTPYNNTEWQTNVRNAMTGAFEAVGATSKPSVALIGHKKDFGTSFYLDMFPEWGSIGVENLFNNLSATMVREHLFETGGWDSAMVDYIPASTHGFIRDFVRTPDFKELLAEVDYYRDYRKAHAEAEALIEARLGYKTKIKHNTVDAMVVQSGHILLIQRKNLPGRGLMALPGGFLEDEEWNVDGFVRELREETKIKVPNAVIRGGMCGHMLADYPYRSMRGRVISNVYLVKLPDGPFPFVKGRSDAKLAMWVPLNEVRPENMFEDHYHIIQTLLAQLPHK